MKFRPIIRVKNKNNVYFFRHARTMTSPHLVKALNSSKRIQARVDDVMYRHQLYDPDLESDVGLDILRESLREERNTLNDAIKEADRE